MTIQQYITKLDTLYKTGNAREHSYRGDLQNLIMAILPDVLVTNEPARVDCGAPDYVLTRKDVPIGYIEAKDIGQDLTDKKLKEQFDRYKAGLSNLIFTDYLDFHFYKDGEFITKIAIAKIENGAIAPLQDNFEHFANLITNFAQTITQTIKSPTKLAQMMAGKAKLMADVIEKSLNNDDLQGSRSSIKSQMLSFQQMLIHDIDNKAFADIYAQTIAYGMFAARYHDPTLPTFSREEAATLIPKSNPFLRKLFQDIAGYDLDNRLVWIVEELVSIFLASDVAVIMKNFGRSTKQEDPVVHFYETFLSHYNKKLKIERGVWYTPQPVVNFIVRAVDDILKTEFNLPQGLADTSKIKIKKSVPKFDDRSKTKSKVIGEQETEVEMHKVQILDPATGTGTFLAEVVKHIYKKFEGQQGIWSKYVTNDLIPRLNGFELLMASYAMAHLKMDMLLTETGYKSNDDQRFRIFLTNSLEEAHPDTQTLFSSWLSDEADQANTIKREAPVMVIMGNPPYSVSSSNKSEWIQNLISDYKKNLNERKINLDDDYIKFTRFGQHFIDKNGEGILAYISSNSFIDGITHRQMRKQLLESFDKIYIFNLHGNAKKKEVSPDGSPDQNVFDIMTGVSINIFVKKGRKKESELGKILHCDLYGKRDFKYQFLEKNLNQIDWKELNFEKPYYFFVPKNFDVQETYNSGFKMDDLFGNYNTGIQTKNDAFTIQFKLSDIREIETNILKMDVDELEKKYSLKDGTWKMSDAKKDLMSSKYNISDILIKPFDKRYTILNQISSGFLGRPRYNTMKHMVIGNNLALLLSRQNKSSTIDSFFITDTISEMKSAERTIQSYHFPLYLYCDNTNQQSAFDTKKRIPNLSLEIVNKMAKDLNIFFSPEKAEDTNQSVETNQFTPIDLLDYIYAVLHSPTYREKYKEFLKIDFPRVPYPKDQKTFFDLVNLGSQLREIHLLESPIVDKYITQYPEDGDNVVAKPRFEQSVMVDEDNEISHRFVQEPIGRVYINDRQFFEDVPEVAWNFYIGGYQPAQKWLKDRKDRELSYEDILHYQKIIVALTETERLMKEIDNVLIC